MSRNLVEIDTALMTHEDTCAVRYKGIRDDIADLKSTVRWAGGITIAAIIAVLGWSLNNQWQANQAAVTALQVAQRAVAAAAHPVGP